MQLDVVVEDASGSPVPGLEARDFALLDNGQPNKIISFQAYDGNSIRSEPAVALIVVIDMIQLPANLIRDELSSVETFLRRNGGHLQEPVSIFTVLQTGLWQVAEASLDGNALAIQVAHTTAFRLVPQLSRKPTGRYPCIDGTH